jgi:type II secretory pathway pseudopilin PulG
MKKNNFTKLTQKKGVSLIVLIVTIIVVIILAATVILTISKNNPIESAKEARFKEDMRTFQDELNMVMLKQYVEKQGQRDEKITADKYTKGGEKNSVYTYLSSFTKKYENKIAIKEGSLVYVGTDEKEKQWLVNSGIYISKKITVHYKDGDGNKLKESEEYPVLDVEYRFEAADIEGYMPLNEVE